MYVSFLASFGAMITIMASFTGFFSQQLVQFQDCRQQDRTAFASILRTNSYTRTGGVTQANVPVDFPPMMAAINVGVLQPLGNLTNVFSSGCNSGNCTFSTSGGPAFSTLAISHFCSDITARIRIINQTQEISNQTSAFLGLDFGANKTFAWSRGQGGPVLNTFVYDNVQSSFTTIYFVFRSTWSQQDWRAVNCTILPTIATYTASIQDAVLEEIVTEIAPLQMLGAQFKEPPVLDKDFSEKQAWYTHLMTTNYTVRDGIRVACEGAERSAPGLTKMMRSSNDATYANATGHTNPSAGWRWWYYPNDCVWSIHKFAYMAIRNSLIEVFDDKEVGMGRRTGVMGPVQLRVLFEDGNITLSTVNERMKNLTALMTSVVRTNGGNGWTPTPYTQPVPEISKGDVWINTTCVVIRWKWMSFPAIMIALTGVFLVLVVFENRGIENDRLWKSSFLAALFCDVEVHESPVGKEEMGAVAKSTSVSLEGKSGRLRLVAG
jgi:hypothetical protein